MGVRDYGRALEHAHRDETTIMYRLTCALCDYRTGKHTLPDRAEQAYVMHWRMKHKVI